MKIKGDQTSDTYGTIGGMDFDYLKVQWWYQPAEKDVGVSEGVEINTVLDADGTDITDNATEMELALLSEKIMEDMYLLQDDDGGWEPPEPDEAQEWYDFDPDC